MGGAKWKGGVGIKIPAHGGFAHITERMQLHRVVVLLYVEGKLTAAETLKCNSGCVTNLIQID